MANAITMIGISSSSTSWAQLKNFKTKSTRESNKGRKGYVSASATTISDPYRTLSIYPDASKSEVKKAFRELALQIVMSQLRRERESTKPVMETYEPDNEETEEAEMRMNDSGLDLWEEWMGWEGAGIRDYSSHINPYL